MIRVVGLVLVGVTLAGALSWFSIAGGNKDRRRESRWETSAPAAAAPTNPTPRLQAVAPTLPQASSSAIRQASPRPNRKRAWDRSYLASLASLTPGSLIRVELVNGEFSSGHVRYLQHTNDQMIYISGDLERPAEGRFFFQKQTLPGVAGDFVGLITFSKDSRAYRIEPTGPQGAPELVERPLNEVTCLLPPLPAVPAPQTADIPPLNPADFPSLPIPVYQSGIVVLESLHGAKPVIYLDFQGGYTAAWGGIAYERPNVSNAQIRDVWQRVAEDFMPFNINVTTDLAVFQNAPENSRQRVIITPTTTAGGSSGGVAQVGSFNWTGDTPCWVFTLSGKGCAEACSHEAGHTLGLIHDGQFSGGLLYEYYTGHGIGDTSWAPIMGLPYFANVTQWSKGEYVSADNLQDQLTIISSQNNNVAYRPDDTGETLASSRYLELYPDDTASAEGVIERTGDQDAFRFTTQGGALSLRADPVGASPNLAVQVGLYDEQDALMALSNPQDTLWAELVTNLPGGTYTFRVTGAGRNDALTNGFSSYASLGYYSITGSVARARQPDRFAVFEHATNGTVIGAVSLARPQDPFLFRITSGNPNNTFAVEDSGVLKVANNQLLDYDTLAARTQLPVQFEFFLDVIDQADTAFTETNRRVVIAVKYVPTPPAIQKQPGDLVVAAGSNPLLTVNAIGDLPLSYQWFFNDLPISGAAGPGLSLIDVQARDAGAYSVTITNMLGAITSQVAHLGVTPIAPLITRQPQPQATVLGFPVSLNVAAEGTKPIGYQWQFNGTNLAGATNSSLYLADVLPQFIGSYEVVVSNEVGSTRSAEAPVCLEPIAAWGWNDSGQTNLYPDLTNAVQISAGPDYNLALRRDGTVFEWGATNETSVPRGLTNAIAVAAGSATAVALRNDGTVLAWGVSAPGQPGLPTGLNRVVAVAAGGGHSLALRADGHVVAWGLNTNGQASVPPLLTNVVAIAAGGRHSLALDAGGNVRAWGDNSQGQTQVPDDLNDAIAIAAGATHSLALRLDGTVVGWGNNSLGQTSIPTGLSDIIAIATGAYHSLAMNRTGVMFAWGAGMTNSLKYPQLGQCLTPQPIRNGNVTAIAGGEAHTLAFDGQTAPFVTQSPPSRSVLTGHRVIFRVAATGGRPLGYQWQLNGTNFPGAADPVFVIPFARTNHAGQYRVSVSNALGSMTSAEATLTVLEAAPIIAGQPIGQQPFVGGQTTLQVTAYGSEPLSYQWRFNGLDLPGATGRTLDLRDLHLEQSGFYSVVVSNYLGVLSSAKAKVSVMQVVAWGAGTNTTGAYSYGQSMVPPGMSTVDALAGGSYHSLALEHVGRVVAWGAGTNQLGQQGYNASQSVVPVALTDAIAVAGGLFHSLALRRDGSVLGWGISAAQSIVPPSLNDVVAIAAGNYHSVALTRNGRVTAWASAGATALTNLPASVINVVTISSRANQIVAVKGDGHVVRWGNPAVVPAGLSEVVEVSAGVTHALALKKDGTVAALDNGFDPPAGLSNVVQIAAGNGFSVALQGDGTVVTWGTASAAFLGVLRPPAGLKNVTAVACGDYHCLAALGNESVAICAQPRSHQLASAVPTFLRVGATGRQPLSYQWHFNDLPLPQATNSLLGFDSFQDTNVGSYYVVITNGFGAVTSSVATLALTGVPEPPAVPLESALGSSVLSWSQGGNAAWFGQTNFTLNGAPAAQSGPVLDSQQTWLQTSLAGPGTLDFWWKVSSEQFFDRLNLYLDGSLLLGVSGEVDWRQVNLSISSGPHLLRWNYEKDASASAGLDSAWLAQVSFLPDFPRFVTQPIGQTSELGARIILSATAIGAPPLALQWIKDGTILPGATNTGYMISNATRRSSGSYLLSASNSTGNARSLSAPVLVRVPQRLQVLPSKPGDPFQLLSSDADGGGLLPGDLAGFQVQVSTNLVDWLVRSNLLELTNGSLLLTDPQLPERSGRFYRLKETP